MNAEVPEQVPRTSAGSSRVARCAPSAWRWTLS